MDPTIEISIASYNFRRFKLLLKTWSVDDVASFSIRSIVSFATRRAIIHSIQCRLNFDFNCTAQPVHR